MSNCPDLVLIHLGTNDVTALGEGKTLPQLLSFTPTSVNNVNKIVNHFTKINRGCKFIVAKIIPVLNIDKDSKNYNLTIEKYNKELEINFRNNANVYIIDMYKDFNQLKNYNVEDDGKPDPVHPSRLGAKIMAERFYTEIRNMYTSIRFLGNIVAVGDSITAGVPFTYRYELDQLLKKNNYVFKFIGPLENDEGVIEAYNNFYQNFLAISGLTTGEIYELLIIEYKNFFKCNQVCTTLYDNYRNLFYVIKKTGPNSKLIYKYQASKTGETCPVLLEVCNSCDIFNNGNFATEIKQLKILPPLDYYQNKCDMCLVTNNYPQQLANQCIQRRRSLRNLQNANKESLICKRKKLCKTSYGNNNGVKYVLSGVKGNNKVYNKYCFINGDWICTKKFMIPKNTTLPKFIDKKQNLVTTNILNGYNKKKPVNLQYKVINGKWKFVGSN